MGRDPHQHRLVEVILVPFLLKKPRLDRCQGCFQFWRHAPGGAQGSGSDGESLHIRGFEDVPDREVETFASRPGHDLQGKDAVTAGFEEIIVNTNPLQPQDFREEGTKNLLRFGVWCRIGGCCTELWMW